MNKIIGKRLKLIRQNQNLSQLEFAKILGVSQSYYANIERGRYSLKIDFIICIKNKFNINPTWLLTGEGPMWLEPPDQCERDKEDIGESIKSWIDNFLKNASQEEMHWFKVQFSKCFPEFLEWMEERKKKYEEKNNV